MFQSNMWLHIQNAYDKMAWRGKRMKLKKMDMVLCLAVLVIAGCSLLGYSYLGKQIAARVIVEQDGKVIGEYSLQEDKEIKINETNVLSIQEGHVDMTWADCRDQICVKHKSISKNGETIVCLPNKIIVMVESDEDAALDATAK